MTAAQIAQRQKAEAEAFLRRVQTEYPHLVQLGYQRIIDVTVQGMKELGIYHDDGLTEPKFMAGLQHAMNTGVVPKPPAQVVQVQAPPSEQQIEDSRVAEQVRQDAERDRKYSKQRWQSSKKNHALDPQEPENREREASRAQVQAKNRCDLIRGNSHSHTEQIAKCFVMMENNPAEIDWIRTEIARQRIARQIDLARHTNPRY